MTNSIEVNMIFIAFDSWTYTQIDHIIEANKAMEEVHVYEWNAQKSCDYQLFYGQQHLYICCVHARTQRALASSDPVHNHFVQIRTHMLAFALLTFALTHTNACVFVCETVIVSVWVYCSCVFTHVRAFDCLSIKTNILNKNFFFFLVDRIGLLFIINKWLLLALLLLSLFVCSRISTENENIAPSLFWHFNR